MILSEHLSKEQGLSDLLNYAHFVDEGIIINKDGAFLSSYQFRGPDIHSATEGELEALTNTVNRTMTQLGDGWMIHVDEIRIPSHEYPERNQSYFPNEISEKVDDIRRVQYQAEGAHFENVQYLTFVWKFPLPLVKTTRHWFVEGLPEQEDTQNLTKLLSQFKETVERCLGLLSAQLKFQNLNSSELLEFLNTCISGEMLPIAIPREEECFVDNMLGRRALSGGYIPRIGKRLIYVLSIIGYVNAETYTGLLDAVGVYPLMYRWSNRFIPLSEFTAEKEIKRFQKHWHNKVRGLMGLLKEAIFKSNSNQKLNHDAIDMLDEINAGLTANSNQSTRFGYFTSSIVLIHEDNVLIQQAIKSIRNYLEQKGFACVVEDVNALEAWLGSVPGHGSCNARRLFLSGYNLAHMLPLHSLWTGSSFSSVASLLPKNSPPVFYAATTGYTPFRFHLDVSDVGHQLILGPTGSGKSTWLAFLMAQFLRYENARIFIFDKDCSHREFTKTLGGNHYDIGNAAELAFCPLGELSTESQRLRAAQFIENLVVLQNVEITLELQSAISEAIKSLADSQQIQNRNLTIFASIVQHPEVRLALRFYTLQGQFKLLDADKSTIDSSYLNTFEMGWLLAQKPAIYLPVLMYLFDYIESFLEANQAKYPTLIILEEAWLYIQHPIFAAKLRDWLKTLRKKNARVIFATQSLSDLYDPSTQSLTTLTATLLESCPTKIYLPNPKMESEMKSLYQKMGLNDRQIEILSQTAIPKKHYYVVTPEGNRLIELGLKSGKVQDWAVEEKYEVDLF